MLVAASCLLTWSPRARQASAPTQAAPMDWPYCRGPEMNGISREKNIVADWDPEGGEGSNLLWKREDLASRSTPISMNGKLYVLTRSNPGTKSEGEQVVCVDAATGETLWENKFNVFLSDVPDTRVGWSSVTGDPVTGNVFALGVCDYLQCINGETGETIWSHSLSEEYGMLSTYGGRTNFPIIHENLVLISGVIIGWGEQAKPRHSFIAFDKRNGQAVWFDGTRPLPDDTTYSAPVLAVIDGQWQMVFGSGDGGIYGFQPQTGKQLWRYDVSMRGVNTSPLVVGSTVYCGHSEENTDTVKMGALFAIDASKQGLLTKENGVLWKVDEWFVGKSAPLMVDGRLYAIEDNANLLIVDPKTGKEIASKKLGTMQRSDPIYADGKIYTCTANGRWYTLKPTEDGVEIVHKMRFNREESHGSPIVSHGRLYVPTTGALYCIGQKDQEPVADPRPELPAIKPAADLPDPALLQIAPVESLLYPGERQVFQARLYNARGQYVGMAENVEYTLDGPGHIDAEGRYTTPSDHEQAAVIVKAKSGDLEGEARIRIVPELDWAYNFDNGRVPITWVGARYRHVAIDETLWSKLREQDRRAAQLYIYLMSSYTNTGAPTAKYADISPRQGWTDLLLFLGLVEKAQTVDAAKELLDPSLKLLADEKVIGEWSWAAGDSGRPQLTVPRGPRKIDGNGVMIKITTIPKGTRSQAWMGHPNMSDYTIQADMMSGSQDGKLPDMGLIAQRYTIDMMGASQQMQIRTWPPQLRMAVTVPFEWKPYTWYTLKFKATTQDGKAVLYGKAWPRGEQEPAEWTLQAVDESPNLIGAPGLYGNAKDGEVFYDNLTVTRNKPSGDQTVTAKPAESKPPEGESK